MSDGDHRDSDYIDINSVRVNRSDEMIHSELRSLYSYWDALRAGRKTPLRSDIDPRDMQCDARNLFILENLGRGNIRFRLAGTAIVDAFGMELRGMNARAIMSTGSRESFTALITETLEDPGVGYARLRSAADEAVVWEISLLPLRSDFGMIDRVIGCLHPLSGKNSRRGQSLLRFRIEQMSVDPINATVRDIDLPTPIEGFADPARTFEHKEIELPESAKPRFETIAGGRTRTDDEDRPTPTRGHLRLVKD